jgi:hypothetical protein
MRVYKYELEFKDDQTILMPGGAQILTFAVQHKKPCIWALVDPNELDAPRRFRMAGTGHPIEVDPNKLEHIGTVQLAGGDLIFHLFEVK